MTNVLTFSTAAGKESDERLSYWENLAIQHFKDLNVNHKHIDARNRDDLNKDLVIEDNRSSSPNGITILENIEISEFADLSKTENELFDIFYTIKDEE